MRIVARLIDAVIGGVFGAILAAIIISGDGSNGFAGFGGSGSFGKRYLVTIGGLIFSFLYEAVVTAVAGGTPGKLILGMRVVNAADGSAVQLPQSAIRWAIPGALSIIPILGGLAAFVIFVISLIFLFTDKLRQTVSDKVAKTLVVKK